MMRQKLVTTFLSLLMFFLLATIFVEKISAHGQSSTSSTPPVRLQPNIMPPPRPTIFIQYKWSPKDIIEAFKLNGLDVEDTGLVTESDYSSLPARAKETTRFSTPSIGANAIGCILSFDRREDMEKVKDYYRGLNKKEELYSWSFEKDNILIVLNGTVEEEKARLFEHALAGINKK